MARVVGYLRTVKIDQAIEALQRTEAVALGGGTKLNAGSKLVPVVAVDLQALGLDTISEAIDGSVVIGATARLEDLLAASVVPSSIREAARREEPSTLRTLATVGGAIAVGDPESELLATLLVHEASVSLATTSGPSTISLESLFSDMGQLRGRVITSVTLAAEGVTAAARVGRTRADRPIVAAVARRTASGRRLLALSGISSRPLLVPPVGDPLRDAVNALVPPDDFRGSREYRRALATVLSRRVMEEVG